MARWDGGADVASVPAVAGGVFFLPSPWTRLGLLFLCPMLLGDLVAWRSARGERTRVSGTARGRGDFGRCAAPLIVLLLLSTVLPRGAPPQTIRVSSLGRTREVGTRPNDGAISVGKGAMGGVGLGEPSERPLPLLPAGGTRAPSYQGVCFPSYGLKPMLMMGHYGFSGAPPRGWWRVRVGAFPDDGTCSTGAECSTGQSSRAIAKTERWS